MRSYLFAIVIAMLPICPAARADTIFNLHSNEALGALIEGTVDINTTTGVVDFADLTYTYNGLIETFMEPVQQSPYNGDYLTLFSAFNGSIFSGYYYRLILPVTTLVGYQGGLICSEVNGFGGACALLSTTQRNGSFYDDALDGTLTPNTASSVTPEPSSLALFCTGLLGVVGVVRKRCA